MPGLLSSVTVVFSNFARPAEAFTLLATDTAPIAAPGAMPACDHSSTRRSDGAANFTWPSR